MVIGCDIDGVLNILSARIRFKLPWWFLVCLAFIKPNQNMVQVLRKWNDSGDKILLVSARPKQIEVLTKKWLERHKIPYDQIFLVGQGEGIEHRKLEIIRKEGIDMFIDDDNRIVSFLKQFDINALSSAGVL